MFKGHRSLTLFTLVLAAATSARGGDPPVSQTIPIDVTVSANDPYNEFFPNVFDPLHPKVLRLNGIARVTDPAPGSTLFVRFDWIDLQGEQQFSDLFSPFITLNQIQDIDLNWTIPFCPQQVSLHLGTEGPGSITFIGSFTHECVPEPSSIVLAGFGAAGFGLVAYRRRVKR